MIISPNEARVLENLNAREGGDVYLQPLNMVDGTKPAPKRKRGTFKRNSDGATDFEVRDDVE